MTDTLSCVRHPASLAHQEVEDNFTAHMEQFTEQMREKEEELEEERHSHNLTQEELQSIKQVSDH